MSKIRPKTDHLLGLLPGPVKQKTDHNPDFSRLITLLPLKPCWCDTKMKFWWLPYPPYQDLPLYVDLNQVIGLFACW